MKIFRRANRREWLFALAFVGIDAALLWGASRYFGWFGLGDGAAGFAGGRNPATLSFREEYSRIEKLEAVAHTGDFQQLENTRSKMAAEILNSRQRPSRGVAVYFFPETLPSDSLEKNFADRELKPGLEALRTAHLSGGEGEKRRAYDVLETRVKNYELGAVTDEEDLSEEARRFLGVYHTVCFK